MLSPLSRPAWTVLAMRPEHSKILTSPKRELVPCLSPIRAYLAQTQRVPNRAHARHQMPTPAAVHPLMMTTTHPCSGHAARRTAVPWTGSTSACLAPGCWLAPSWAPAPHCCWHRKAAAKRERPFAVAHGSRATARATRGRSWPTSWRPSRGAAGGAPAVQCAARAGAPVT